MSPTTLFTHLKIILLQYFQFSPAVFAFFFFFLFFIFYFFYARVSAFKRQYALFIRSHEKLCTVHGPTSTLFK